MSLKQDLLTVSPNPVKNVEIDIVNFSGVGGHIKVGGICSFQVRVENYSHLDIINLELNIYGSEWTTVSNCSFPMLFRSLISSGKKNVNAHSSVTFGPFYLRAVQATSTNSNLISVTISSLDTGSNHILHNHEDQYSNPSAYYCRRVHP